MSKSVEQVGICDEESIENDNEINFLVNKIGGLPKFLPSKVFVFKECANCSGQMALVTQLYCPLGNSVYHRVLYLTACVNQSCWNKSNSWYVYRSQYPDFDYINNLDEAKRRQQQQQKENSSKSFINKDWGSDVSDWDDDDDGTKAVQFNFAVPVVAVPEPVKQQQDLDDVMASLSLDKLDLSSSECSSVCEDELQAASTTEEVVAQLNETIKEMFNNWKFDILPKITKVEFNNEINQFGYFRPFYVNVMNKKTFIDENKKPDKVAIDEYNNNDVAMDTDKSITRAEEYEEGNLKHGDKIFFKFRKSIDFCPSQIIRYYRGSKPLFIKSHDDFDANTVKCSYCGAKCIYEFQVMPALVNYLKTINNNNSIEFGVVIVYSCSQNCWNDTDLYRIEHVYVQSDPDDKLFN